MVHALRVAVGATCGDDADEFEVPDNYATVKELRGRGVTFEEYDVPGLRTVEGVAEHESGARGAWFKDPDGNILQIGQYS